jgi:hypothetical protein
MAIDNLQISSDNEADILAKAEAAVAEADGTTPVVDDDTVVPDVIEDEDTDEDPAVKVDGLEIPDTNEVTEEDVTDVVGDELDLESYYAEYAETGTLTEESTKTITDALKKGGIGNAEAVLQQYMAGADSQVAGMRSSAFEIAGGEEGYSAMASWAEENLSVAERASYDVAVNDPNLLKLAVSGLHAQFTAATGNVTQADTPAPSPRVTTGVVAQSGHAPVNSKEQVAALVTDPQYVKDPGFRAAVDARIAASMRAGLIK